MWLDDGMNTTTCTAIVWRKRSIGVLSKGTESFREVAEVCGNVTHDGHELCPRCRAKGVRLQAKLDAKRAREAWVAERNAK